MSITSNAESREDKGLADRHAELHPEAQHDLKFLKKHVVVFDAEANSETRYTRKQYQAYLDGLGEPERGSEDAAEALPPQSAEPRSGFVEQAAEFDESQLEELSDRAFVVGLAERQGDLNKNSARFERGELMVSLSSIAKAERIPFKDVLARVNDRMAQRAAEDTLADFQLITEQEATTTRRVVETFGSSAEFRQVGAINPNTGEPLVDDAGEPPLTDIRQVPMNKLYSVADQVDGTDYDLLVSFAYRYDERVVKKAKSVAKNTGKTLASIIKRLDRLRQDGKHAATGEVIKVQVGTKAALEKLRDWSGEAPPPDVVSIKTDRAWHDSFWVPLKALFSALQRQFNPELMGEATEVSNVHVFERTIGQFFNVNAEDGVRGALASAIEAEDITEEQARQFVEHFHYNPGSGEWESDAAEAAPDEEGEWDDEDEGFDDVEIEA